MSSVFKKIVNGWKRLTKHLKVVNPVLPTTPEHQYDLSLVETIEEVLKLPNFTAILKDPVSKIYVISTYSTSYNDLGTMLTDRRYNRKIIAINLHSYFGGEEELVHSGLTRIKEWMKTSKLTPEAVHDLYELTSTIKHLTELRGG